MRVYEAKIVYNLVSLGEEVALDNAEKVANYLRSAFDENPAQEAFYAVYLDRRNHPIGRHMITLGTATNTLAHPREVFRGAILANAAALVVAHNHPSGDPAPSSADIKMTRVLREASQVLDIPLLDHVICGHKEADPMGRGHRKSYGAWKGRSPPRNLRTVRSLERCLKCTTLSLSLTNKWGRT